MSLLKQYKDSLKTIEAEEIFDLLIFRPLAFIFVKITYPLNFLTPNLVSTFAMLFGVIGGVMFGFGSQVNLTCGAGLYFVCNVLDCADGQIARLKHNGTKVGRIVDGFIDYVVSIAVFIGIGIGMTHEVTRGMLELRGNVFDMHPLAYVWIITILAGFSSALQAFLFDFYRNKFLEVVHGRFSPLEDEIREYTEELERIEREPDKAGFLDSFLITIYLKYTGLQMKMQSGKPAVGRMAKPNPKVYYMQNKVLLRLWSFVGSTTHITLCVAAALAGNLEAFLLICILPLNLLTLALYLAQTKVNLKFS